MIKDYEGFRRALYEVDMGVLNEELVNAVQEKLLEPELFKKLREKPAEAFKDAPEGEKVGDPVLLQSLLQLLACLSHVKDLPSRLRALSMLITFPSVCNQLKSNFSVLAEACDEIRHSVGLGHFISLVLACGNFLMKSERNNKDYYGFVVALLTKVSQIIFLFCLFSWWRPKTTATRTRCSRT